MSSHVFGARARRFTIALALFTLGPLALPGGPLDGEHRATLTRVVRVATSNFRPRAENRPAVAKAPHREIRRSQDLPPGLFVALTETQHREAGVEYAAAHTASGFRFANRGQRFDADFRPSGVNLTPQSFPSTQPVTLRLATINADGETRLLTPFSWRKEAARVARTLTTVDGLELTEWYINSPLGLEQGFTIKNKGHRARHGARDTGQGTSGEGPGTRDKGEDRLRLSIVLESGTAQSSITGAILTDAFGHIRLSYGALAAWDATGRPLTARLDVTDRLDIVVDATGAAYPITIDPIVQQAQLMASDGGTGDRNGFSVALDGDTALVGAVYDDVGANVDQGSVYVFSRSGTTWTEQAKLVASDAAVTDNFGHSVALDGDTALVGAIQDDVGANANQGSAYIFTRSGTTWTQQAKLVASDGAFSDLFGYSVALDGDTALVGAFADDVGPNEQGSAYVFTRSGTTWTQQAQLVASDGASGDEFGIAVALDGDTALVGAFRDDVGANGDQGSAYVFTRSGTSWTQQAQLLATDGTAGDQFGFSVALDGNSALVGAFTDDVGANTDQGSAYVFTRSGTIWTQQAQLLATDGAAGDRFGFNVALDTHTALVGADLDNVGGNTDQGSAYVFIRSGTTWTQHAQLVAADGVAGDDFGYSVALDGDTALVGALTDDVGANTDQGSAYVFTGLPAVQITLSASPPNIFPSDRRYKRVTLAATDAFGAPLTCAIQSVQANTPQQGVQIDYVIVSPMVVDLRAERPINGAIRVYTVTVNCGGASDTLQVAVTGVR